MPRNSICCGRTHRSKAPSPSPPWTTHITLCVTEDYSFTGFKLSSCTCHFVTSRKMLRSSEGLIKSRLSLPIQLIRPVIGCSGPDDICKCTQFALLRLTVYITHWACDVRLCCYYIVTLSPELD